MADDSENEPENPTPKQPADPIRATVAGNKFELIESGEARLEAILELIGGARKRLRLLFYMFNNDDCGRRVIDAVVEACKRGVKVEMLLDGFGCADPDLEFFEGVSDAGGSFCMFHARYGRRYLVRNHQKLAIADDDKAIIGGSNIHDSYLKDEGPKHWRDLWLTIDGPAVKHACGYFDDIYRWTTAKGSKLWSLRQLIADHNQTEGAVQWKFNGPFSRRQTWTSAFNKELESVERLDLIAAYFSPHRSMLRRLMRVAQRGKVRIITASKSDNRATVAAARHTYRRLLRRGVEMYEYQPARLHTKLAITDNSVHIGSSNFDFRSLYLNLEIMLRIEDSDFVKAMRGYFEREMTDSEQITPELHRERSNMFSRMRWQVSHWLVTSMDYTVTRRLNIGG